MTFYRHINPALSREQEANFVTLARFLVTRVAENNLEPELEFDMGWLAVDKLNGDELQPDQVAAHTGPLLCGPVACAIRAGIAALPGEDWRAYQTRILGATFDSPLEDWLLSSLWVQTDNTAIGAAMRLMYVLDYGVPEDWMAIIHGQAESDYLTNSFLWDRVGLAPPERT